MTKPGTYFLGRITKQGQLDEKALLDSFKNPFPIRSRKNAWTFIDVAELTDDEGDTFIYGKLCKFTPEASIRTIDPEKHVEESKLEPNVFVASSPFVYVPKYSGIAFLYVPNQVTREIFTQRFRDIIHSSFTGLLFDVNIEMITDLRSFATKLLRLTRIYRIAVTLSHPNPLFGPLWKPLKEYIEKRKSEKMKIEEQSSRMESLNTELLKHVQAILQQNEGKTYTPSEEVPIVDAAMLMAADGYGEGVIEGISEDGDTIIRTSETVRQFSFDREPEPSELIQIAIQELQKISDDRDLKH